MATYYTIGQTDTIQNTELAENTIEHGSSQEAPN